MAGVGALAVTALQNRPANDASGASGVLANGTTAPDVTLASTTGTTVRLADLRGKRNVLLYFYEHAG